MGNKVPSEIDAIMSWSLEAFYQFLLATSVDAKKIEAARKTNEEKLKALRK